MNSQQHADLALARWQQMRDLAPDERIEALMADFFQPPIELDVRYQDQLDAIAEAMS